MWPYLLVLLGIIALLFFYLFSVYNKLIKFRERVNNAFSQIDVQLERRHDLIPNLVTTAKEYLSHERETLESVIAARASATQARVEVNGDASNLEAMQKLAQSEGTLGGALGRLMAISESYPDLKANQTMSELSEELTTTENKISFARQSYNDQVTTYNTYKSSVPPVIVANMFNFADSVYLDLDDEPEKRENINVSFE